MQTTVTETSAPDTLSVLKDPPVTAALVDELSHLWVRVTNAGGSVGFVPPVSLEQVRPHTVSILSKVIDRTDTLVAIQKGAAEVVAWCVLTSNDSPPRSSWRTMRHVQVDPEQQGAGIGGVLLSSVDRVAKNDLGLRALSLKARTGTGAVDFYQRHGFHEVGRLPRAVEIGPDDWRDDIIMWKEL
ncbi:GNAT family N-acetyltransferase [Salininema proteolyticum]|uniref:GNAT family N-acetyltransferase n=1 Tax=Salininema proteolyticum TaxID=1607685 RepID=A0ABV8TTQ8_9ACTN